MESSDIPIPSEALNFSGEILILTGTPGAGKTTTAKALASKSGSAKVHLHSDDFWHFIKNGYIEPYLPEANGQNEVVIKALAKAASSYALGNYFVILDGIIGPWFLEPFINLQMPLHYIVLRPPLSLAIERCRQRGADTLTDPGPIAALYDQFSALGPLEKYVLPIGEQTKDETLSSVIEALRSGRHRLR